MKIKWLKFFDKIIVLLLGVAGLFSGCNVIDSPDPLVEYGMPYADFELRGIVTSATTSQPVKNIRIVRPHWFSPEGNESIPGDTIYTDAQGIYIFTFGGAQHKYQLKFEDIDGPENGGLFVTKEIQGEFTQADLYQGKFVKTQNVILERENYAIPAYGVIQADFQP